MNRGCLPQQWGCIAALLLPVCPSPVRMRAAAAAARCPPVHSYECPSKAPQGSITSAYASFLLPRYILSSKAASMKSSGSSTEKARCAALGPLLLLATAAGLLSAGEESPPCTARFWYGRFEPTAR